MVYWSLLCFKKPMIIIILLCLSVLESVKIIIWLLFPPLSWQVLHYFLEVCWWFSHKCAIWAWIADLCTNRAFLCIGVIFFVHKSHIYVKVKNFHVGIVHKIAQIMHLCNSIAFMHKSRIYAWVMNFCAWPTDKKKSD